MADEKNTLDNDDIERLLQQSSASGSPPLEEPEKSASAGATSDGSLSQDDIEALLDGGGSKGAPAPVASAPQASPAPPPSPAEPDDAGAALKQDDVDRLLGTSGGPSAPEPRKSAVGQAAPQGFGGSEGGSMPQGDVEYLLNRAQRALESIDSEPDANPPPGLASFRFEEFAGEPASSDNTTLDLINDVQLDLKIELGRTHMYLEDVLRLSRGSVVSLDKLAGDPVDIYVNERLIARGEVLVLNDNFCVRVGELIAGATSEG